MAGNILLTGASRGLGLAIARVLLDRGFAIYCVSRTEGSELAELRNLYPGRVHFHACDLRAHSDIQQELFHEFLPLETPLLGYVNNAAVAYDDLVTNLDLVRLQSMFSVNVFTPMEIVKYAIRNMLYHRTAGAIVHISSISAHTGYKGLAMYASTKGALEAFSKNTAREWGERGIRSNCVVAGFMETEMSSGLTDDQRRRIFQRTALKSPTLPASVAAAVAFLLTPGSSSVTGQNLFVDSGTI